MPYISNSRRQRLDKYIDNVIESVQMLNNTDGDTGQYRAGDLNYIITRILDGAYFEKRYKDMNEIVGVLECAKMEFYRRIAAPYEDGKIKSDGDAYSTYGPHVRSRGVAPEVEVQPENYEKVRKMLHSGEGGFFDTKKYPPIAL